MRIQWNHHLHVQYCQWTHHHQAHPIVLRNGWRGSNYCRRLHLCIWKTRNTHSARNYKNFVSSIRLQWCVALPPHLKWVRSRSAWLFLYHFLQFKFQDSIFKDIFHLIWICHDRVLGDKIRSIALWCSDFIDWPELSYSNKFIFPPLVIVAMINQFHRMNNSNVNLFQIWVYFQPKRW